MPETLTKISCPYCELEFPSQKDLQNHVVDTKACYIKACQDRAKHDPLWLVENGLLTIKTKEGAKKPFILNSTQKRVLRVIKEKIRLGKPIRLWILKARQMGISTLIEAIIFAFTSQKSGINACVLADDLKGSNYIFEMEKLFYDDLESYLKPPIKHSNEKKLAFKTDSQVLVDTAENKNAGHKYTFQFLHGSECARFPYGIEVIMKGLMQAIPNLPMTMVIMETTANGFNEFRDRWNAAKDGKSDWDWLFLAWHEHEEYKMALVASALYPIEGIKFKTVTEKEKFLIEEKELKKKFNLTDEQINWRRFYIVNYCNGYVKDFYEAYPSTDDEAFISTGIGFFDKDGLALQEIIEPKTVGNIVKVEGEYVFREYDAGRFKIYEYPKVGEEYAIGGDTAEGLEHGDGSGWVVKNKKTRDVACVYYHRIPPDEFASDGIMLANYYNEAIIAPENKGYGYGVCQDIWKEYGNIYRNVKTKEGDDKETNELGFNTNRSTRSEMLMQLNEEIKERSTKLNDRELIRQCQSFINIDGKAQAEKGKSDDLVIASAICSQVIKQYPFTRVAKYSKDSYSDERVMVSAENKSNGGFGF